MSEIVYEVRVAGLVTDEDLGDGEDNLEIVGTHIYQYGTPPSSPSTRVLKAFNLFAPMPNTPLQVFSNSTGSPVSGNGHVQLRKHSLGAPRMLASRYYDGLDLVDYVHQEFDEARGVVDENWSPKATVPFWRDLL